MRNFQELRILVWLLIIVIVIYGLIAAKAFLVPVAIAILLSYLLYPLCRGLEKIGLPRIPANLIAIIIGLSVVVGIIFLLSQEVTKFVEDIPHIKEQASQNINELENAIESGLGITLGGTPDGWLKNKVRSGLESSGEIMNTVFSVTASVFATFALMPIYIFLMLYYREKFKVFLSMVVPQNMTHKLENVLAQVRTITPAYMGGLLIVVAILAVLNSTGLLIIGLEHAVFFGVLAAIINIIPYIGTIIGLAIPFAFALIAEDSITVAFYVLILFVIVQFIENNLLTPNITGSKVNINPLVTIMTVILGGIIWGIVGMFIFLPFVAMFKIICENIDPLKPIAFLMGTGGAEKHAITFEKIKRLFRRRLSN